MAFNPDRVRPGSAPELVSSRNFEALQPILTKHKGAIDSLETAVASILSKLKSLAYPVIGGLYVKAGATSRLHDAVLVGGTVTVANTSVTANTRILLSRQTTGGTLGHLSYSISAGVGYTVTSSSGTETSTVTCFLMERV